MPSGKPGEETYTVLKPNHQPMYQQEQNHHETYIPERKLSHRKCESKRVLIMNCSQLCRVGWTLAGSVGCCRWEPLASAASVFMEVLVCGRAEVVGPFLEAPSDPCTGARSGAAGLVLSRHSSSLLAVFAALSCAAVFGR